jgi:uncharacterized protein (TIGR03000 family)
MAMFALAAFSLFLVAGPARAQQGWPINGSNWSYYGGSSASYGRGYSPAYYQYSPAYTASGPVTSSRSYSYGAAETSPVNSRVTLNFTVPANAKIWIENSPTGRAGRQRHFVSPPIQPGRDYSYDIQVKWEESGREVSQKRHITVHAGDVVNLTFPVG